MKIRGFTILKSEIIAVVVIFAIAAFFRLYNLNELPVFVDEAIYVRWAQVMRAETTLRFLPLSDGKQPLFMWIVIPFMKVTTDPLIAGRLVSALSGLATLLGVFSLSYLLFKSKKLSLIAGTLYAISPYGVFFDRMALVDSLLTMFGVWFLIFLILTVKKLRLDYAMLAGFALGGALLTKSPSLYFVILIPTTLLISDITKKNYTHKLIKIFLLWMVTLVIGYAMFNILRLGPNFHMLGARNLDYVHPLTHILQRPLDPFIPHLKGYINYLWLLGPSVLILIIFAGFVTGLKKHKKETILLVFWILVPLLSILVYSKVLTARYLLFILPYLFILSSEIVLSTKRAQKTVAFVLLAVFVIHSLYINIKIITNIAAAPLPASERSGYLEEWSAGGGIKEASIYLLDRYNNGETIVIGTEGYFGTLPDGLQIYLNNYPEITIIGVGLDLREVPQSLLDSMESGNDTYLLINSTRILIDDPSSKGLELVGEYPKPERVVGSDRYTNYGSNEVLYLFKVQSVN